MAKKKIWKNFLVLDDQRLMKEKKKSEITKWVAHTRNCEQMGTIN
jgi:hypothetical protein